MDLSQFTDEICSGAGCTCLGRVHVCQVTDTRNEVTNNPIFRLPFNMIWMLLDKTWRLAGGFIWIFSTNPRSPSPGGPHESHSVCEAVLVAAPLESGKTLGQRPTERCRRLIPERKQPFHRAPRKKPLRKWSSYWRARSALDGSSNGSLSDKRGACSAQ